MESAPIRLTCLLLSLCFIPFAEALDLSREYDHGPVSFEDNVELFFTIDRDAGTAALAVKLTDEDLVAATNTPNWIGIGVSEQASGSMLGSDVATAEFSAGDVDQCQFTDRYVPFYAFPLIEGTPGSPPAFPLRDDCQDDGSWVLVRCERDVATGEMIVEVTRRLEAHDTQDREIGPGFQNIIYAAGTTFTYHQSKRASIRLVLYQEDGGTDLVAQSEPDLPDDIEEEVLITATDYDVPPEFTTTYGCTSKRIKLDKGEKKMIIASEPVINSSVPLVHHLTLFLCRGEEYADLTQETVECGTGLTGVVGPLGNPEAQCVTFLGGYAKGAGRIVLPPNTGILVDEGEYILAMETHYDNPQQLEGVRDSSGMRVFLTNTLREHEAGTLMIGDPLVRLVGEQVQSREYEFSCPADCTKRFPNPVNVYASLLHMHTTGMEIYTNKLTPEGEFVEHFNRINFWSDNFQVITYFDPPKKINPGDHLQMVCKFDTSKRPMTTFGGATSNEMCMDFLGYWPVERDPETGERINICAFMKIGETSLSNATICGDIGRDFSKSILPIVNPNLEDTVGSPTDFGDEQGICDVPSLSPAPDVSATDEPTTPDMGTTTETETDDSTTSSPESDSLTDGDDPTDDDDDNVCFPASATVTLSDGSIKRMSELAIGDEVLVGPDAYSQVFMFTHNTKDVIYKFVELVLEGGNSLALTRGHFLYLNGSLRKAGDAVIGDVVRLGDGSTRRIVGKDTRSERGLYNPQTMHGDIVVDGVVASTYTHSVDPPLAHSLLAPLRWVYLACGVDSSSIITSACL